MSGQFRSCRVRSGHSVQVSSGHVRSVQFMACQFRSCHVRSVQVMSGHIRSGQVIQFRSVQVISGHVRSFQVMSGQFRSSAEYKVSGLSSRPCRRLACSGAVLSPVVGAVVMADQTTRCVLSIPLQFGHSMCETTLI